MGRLDVDEMLAELSPEQFEEWMHSDELDSTISGPASNTEKLTETVANGFSVLAHRVPVDVPPEAFIPGRDAAESTVSDQTDEEAIALLNAHSR